MRQNSNAELEALSDTTLVWYPTFDVARDVFPYFLTLKQQKKKKNKQKKQQKNKQNKNKKTQKNQKKKKKKTDPTPFTFEQTLVEPALIHYLGKINTQPPPPYTHAHTDEEEAPTLFRLKLTSALFDRFVSRHPRHLFSASPMFTVSLLGTTKTLVMSPAVRFDFLWRQ